MKKNTIRITTNALRHAIWLIREYYPELGEEAVIKRATELAEKICRK